MLRVGSRVFLHTASPPGPPLREQAPWVCGHKWSSVASGLLDFLRWGWWPCQRAITNLCWTLSQRAERRQWRMMVRMLRMPWTPSLQLDHRQHVLGLVGRAGRDAILQQELIEVHVL